MDDEQFYDNPLENINNSERYNKKYVMAYHVAYSLSIFILFNRMFFSVFNLTLETHHLN